MDFEVILFNVRFSEIRIRSRLLIHVYVFQEHFLIHSPAALVPGYSDMIAPHSQPDSVQFD